MRKSSLSSRLTAIILVFTIVSSCHVVQADEGIPDELLDQSKNVELRSDSKEVEAKNSKDDENDQVEDDVKEKVLDNKKKASEHRVGLEVDDNVDSNLPLSGQNTLEGRANFNQNQLNQVMPPIAPPIKRYRRPPFLMQADKNIAPLNLNPQRGQPDRPASKLNALKNVFELGASKKIIRPDWIPAHAYTNQSMVAPYHNRDIAWWDKSKMPDKPQWVILSTSVTRYWRGYAPRPCWILVAPNPLAPGNFTFRSKVPNGPRGWLQDMNETSKFGFPLYRYWLDQPGFR